MKNRIRELRQSHGIKQADLAKHLGIAQNTLSYWEQGKYDVDNTSLQKIADFFKCTVDYVLCRDEAPLPVAGEIFTEAEIALIRAYRARPDMQSAVNTLLGIPNGGNISEDMAGVIGKRETAFASIHTESK